MFLRCNYEGCREQFLTPGSSAIRSGKRTARRSPTRGNSFRTASDACSTRQPTFGSVAWLRRPRNQATGPDVVIRATAGRRKWWLLKSVKKAMARRSNFAR